MSFSAKNLESLRLRFKYMVYLVVVKMEQERIQMTDIATIVIKTLIAILFGIFEGNGAVYFFNKMPAEWFCDYGEKPTEEMLDTSVQRVKSTPWKYIFTMFFVIVNTRFIIEDVRFFVAASIVLWLLLELSIGDIKFGILPDQLIALLAVSGIGFISWHGSWKRCLLGVGIGFGIMMLVAAAGKLAYKREAIGGGDIKLFTVLGFLMGPAGVVAVFLMTAFISAGHYVILLIRKRIKRTDTVPMVPYIFTSVLIYMVFLWGRFDEIIF